jgi:hypothetical protein
MEVVEVISFHINNIEEILEVSFRTNNDNEDVSREGKIPFYDISDFGYSFHEETDDEIFEDDDDYLNEFDDDDLFVDENEVLLFLNEYYTLFIDKLPKPEFF